MARRQAALREIQRMEEEKAMRRAGPADSGMSRNQSRNNINGRINRPDASRGDVLMRPNPFMPPAGPGNPRLVPPTSTGTMPGYVPDGLPDEVIDEIRNLLMPPPVAPNRPTPPRFLG